MIAPIVLTAADTCCVLEEPLDEIQAESLAHQLKALADPVRLRLVSIIATSPTGSVCACNLPDAVGKSQPTVSHHLTQLVNAGVLERQQRGKWAWFRLSNGGLGSIRSALGENARHHHTRPPRVLLLDGLDGARAELAAGFLGNIAGDLIDVETASMAAPGEVGQVAVEAMHERDIDIATEPTQRWADDMARSADVVVAIGEAEQLSIHPGTRRLDWEVGAIAADDIEAIRVVRDEIERLVIALVGELTPSCCA